MAGHCSRKCGTVSSSSPHTRHGRQWCLISIWYGGMKVFVETIMSRDKVHCSSVLLSIPSIVSECSIEVSNDGGMLG